jgi:hypothetical protein
MIPYYIGGVYETIPKGTIDLREFIVNISIPSPAQVAQVNEIQRASKAGNEELKQKLKTKLPFFTPAINCTQRRYANITHFTGLMPVDFDKLEPQDAKGLRTQLMKHPYVIAAWLSASGTGVRGLVNVPICQNELEYKARFKALAEQMSIYEGWDNAPQNAVLPLFYSYDREMITNADFTTFTDIYIHRDPPRDETIRIYTNGDDDEKHVVNIIKKKIDSISTTGHYTLRSASYALGGYVGEGYISEKYAIDLMDQLIDQHSYLKIKATTYKKTARTMISQGKDSPLKL